MDFSKIASNFKLFSKTGSNNSTNIEPVSTQSISFTFLSIQFILFCVFFGALTFAYYKKDDLQQFYDSQLSRIIGQLWVFTHLNSNGELASTYVPNEFSLSKWISSFDKNG
jgi:hypothetical protein